ncbi:amino acid ABC transporter permease [Burkholderiaceae bacterium DAT-1]|nr:amino acid ABC transporter permease [Burkholderiaceae bacterium DAT-1]
MSDLLRDYGLYFLIGQYPHGPLGGCVLTILLAALGLLCSLPVGLAFGLARVSTQRWISSPIAILTTAIRATPLLLAVFWIYFFLPALTGHKTGQFSTMLITLIIFNGVYIGEIVAAGIRALPRGQYESARSLGLSHAAAFRYVVLPQVGRRTLPSLINQFVGTIKDTSLGYIIGLTEVSWTASQINNEVLTKPVQVYLLLALVYFVLCAGVSRLGGWVEGRWRG